MKTLLAYLRLTRPANLITAVADIAAGSAIAAFTCKVNVLSHEYILSIWLLAISTICLYGGGVVMNDVADYELDKIERPERPIPNGGASKTGASVMGIALLIAGILFSLKVSIVSGLIAAAIAILALVYDYLGKHHNFFGPLNMGLCRGGNLLLGISICQNAIFDKAWLTITPVIYIAAITMISRGEVVGGNRKAIQYASLMYAIAAGIISFAAIRNNYFYEALPFLALFTFMIYRPLAKAFQNPEPINIRNAVMAGVISIIAMDATIAVCYEGWMYGIAILTLLPLSLLLSKLFAVT